MRTIQVNTTTPYKVIVGENILSNACSEIASVFVGKKILIVTDTGVPSSIVNCVKDGLNLAGSEVYCHDFACGEQSKTPQTLLDIIAKLAALRFSRKDGIVAVGGGVVGDVAGLAASLYMRGIKYVQVPTTLLAAIDSSVGGKTAVDLPEGKNLMGAFYQPSLVVCDVACFKTLSIENILCGLGEGVKYGLLAGGELWSDISSAYLDLNDKLIKSRVNGDILPFDIEGFVAKCVEIKADVVSRDEKESGQRMILNLGHSFGHAIESLAGYTLPHGVCVAKGIAIALRIGVGGHNDSALCEKVVCVLEGLGFDLSCPYDWNSVVNVMLSDKKSGGDYISLVFVKDIGIPVVENVSFSFLRSLK